MRLKLALAVALLLGARPALADPADWIDSAEVSLGAVRETDDWFRAAGLGDGATESLISWMHRFHTLNDHNLAEASVWMRMMLDNGVVDLNGMQHLCTVAPNCIDYMAIGGGFTKPEMLRELKRRNLVARIAIRKMLAVTDMRFRTENCHELVNQAREIPSN
jgi:hypothetical protein